MVKEILTRWPVVRQLLTHSDGTGVEAVSGRTRNLAPKHRDAQVVRSVCPYCAVGCGQLVYHKDVATQNGKENSNSENAIDSENTRRAQPGQEGQPQICGRLLGFASATGVQKPTRRSIPAHRLRGGKAF
jgi:hypothetical protein